jgi:hypothetical protein
MNKLTITLCLLLAVSVAAYKTFDKPVYFRDYVVKKSHRAVVLPPAQVEEGWKPINSWQFQHEKYETLPEELLTAAVASHPYVFGLNPTEKAKWELGRIFDVKERYGNLFEETRVDFELTQPPQGGSRRRGPIPQVPRQNVTCFAKRSFAYNLEGASQVRCEIPALPKTADCLNSQADASFQTLVKELPVLLSSPTETKLNQVCVKVDGELKTWSLEEQTATGRNAVTIEESAGAFKLLGRVAKDAAGFTNIANLPATVQWGTIFRQALDVHFNGVAGNRATRWVIRKLFSAKEKAIPLGNEYSIDLLVREAFDRVRPAGFQGRVVRAKCNIFVNDAVELPVAAVNLRSEIKKKAIVTCKGTPASPTLEIGTQGNL